MFAPAAILSDDGRALAADPPVAKNNFLKILPALKAKT